MRTIFDEHYDLLGSQGLGEDLHWVVIRNLNEDQIIDWFEGNLYRLSGKYTVRLVSVGFVEKKDAVLFKLAFRGNIC